MNKINVFDRWDALATVTWFMYGVRTLEGSSIGPVLAVHNMLAYKRGLTNV